MEHFLELFIHAVKETLPFLPWLLLIYILIELLESKANLQNSRLGGKFGPLIGSATGLIPQCGFSVMASKLYEQKYITLGTLLAIFFSTSDEAFIVLLSSGAEGAAVVLPLIAVKVVVGVLVGYAVDGVLKLVGRGQVRLDATAIQTVTGEKAPETVHEIFMLRYFEELAIEEGCSCGREHEEGKPFKNYFISPVLHALKVAVFIFLVGFVLTFLIERIGEETFKEWISGNLVWQPFLAAAIGLIPNCASSGLLTQTFLNGGVTFGSCVAGLCANAGMGFVVLLKNVKKWKRNLVLIAITYVLAVLAGLLINLFVF